MGYGIKVHDVIFCRKLSVYTMVTIVLFYNKFQLITQLPIFRLILIKSRSSTYCT